MQLLHHTSYTMSDKLDFITAASQLNDDDLQSIHTESTQHSTYSDDTYTTKLNKQYKSNRNLNDSVHWSHFTEHEMNALISAVHEYGNKWVMILNDDKYHRILGKRDAKALEKVCGYILS